MVLWSNFSQPALGMVGNIYFKCGWGHHRFTEIGPLKKAYTRAVLVFAEADIIEFLRIGNSI